MGDGKRCVTARLIFGARVLWSALPNFAPANDMGDE
jgi:hypothetical protein